VNISRFGDAGGVTDRRMESFCYWGNEGKVRIGGAREHFGVERWSLRSRWVEEGRVLDGERSQSSGMRVEFWNEDRE